MPPRKCKNESNNENRRKKEHIYTVSLFIHVNIIRAHAIDVLVELCYPLSLTVVKYRGSRFFTPDCRFLSLSQVESYFRLNFSVHDIRASSRNSVI